MPTRVSVVGAASAKVSCWPVPSPGIRQQVSGRPSSMLAATYVVRLPKASAFGGAVTGAEALAWAATSTGSPTGAVDAGGLALDSLGVGVGVGSAAEDVAAGSLLSACGADWVWAEAGSLAVPSPSGETSSQTPPTATSTIASAMITHGTQGGAPRLSS